MTAVHTAGPWLLTFDPTYPAEFAIDAIVDGRTVHVALVHGVGTDDETQANAALIVTAPALLTLAKEYASECAECGGSGEIVKNDRTGDPADDYSVPCPDCDAIHAVIAVAEGK